METGPTCDARVNLKRVCLAVAHKNAGKSLYDRHHHCVGNKRQRRAKQRGCDERIAVARVTASVGFLLSDTKSVNMRCTTGQFQAIQIERHAKQHLHGILPE